MKDPAYRVERSRRRIMATASAVWIVIIAASLAWDWIEAGNTARMFAETGARSSFGKDLTYRRWAAMHGGVYVPPTDNTPPNPYLAHIPDRDVVTTGGKRLTLINPAYMTRQVFDLSREQYGTRGHITSLRPLRPENAPDPWETKALRAFETGVREVVSIEPMAGGPRLRLMRPLVTEAGCLKCHAAQGYKAGDVRGGISVSIPYGPYLGAIGQERFHRLLVHLLIGALGLAGLWAGNGSLRRAEEEVTRTAQDWQQTFDATNDAIWILDRDQRVVRSNKTAERIFPSAPGGFVGRHCYEIVHGTAEPIPECPILRSRKSLVRESMELPLGDRWLEVIVDPLLDEEGRFNGAVHIVTDITDRRRVDEERERLHAERMQTDKMESIGRLAGGVAHDFNNMLMVILAHSELAMEKVGPTESVHHDLSEIRKAAERSAALTRQMLAFARKQAVVPKVLDLNATVEGMLAMLRRLMGEEIDLAWLPQAGLWRVKMDPGQIDQILANLCANARDAIAGAGKVTIQTGKALFDKAWCARHHGSAPGEYVLLALGDDGSGMEKGTVERLFEPFFTTKEVGRGTGLGLATVYGIVKQNGGYIEVDSEPGKGTTFRIYLPRYAGELPMAGPGLPAELPRGRGETILLVEDEQAVLSMGKSMLESLGYSVLASGTPTEAVSLVEAHPGEIDLLMTDVVMPGMNGKELADRLCAVRPGMKRLFISGYTADIIANHGVLDEGVAFLQKPFLMKDLAPKLREVLEG